MFINPVSSKYTLTYNTKTTNQLFIKRKMFHLGQIIGP